MASSGHCKGLWGPSFHCLLLLFNSYFLEDLKKKSPVRPRSSAVLAQRPLHVAAEPEPLQIVEPCT